MKEMDSKSNHLFGFWRSGTIKKVGPANTLGDAKMIAERMDPGLWNKYRTPKPKESETELFDDDGWANRIQQKLRSQSIAFDEIRNPTSKPIPKLKGNVSQVASSSFSFVVNAQPTPSSNSREVQKKSCDVCKVKTPDLKSHVETYHNEDKSNLHVVKTIVLVPKMRFRAIRCSYCSFVSTSKQKLGKHISIFHVTNLRRSHRRL